MCSASTCNCWSLELIVYFILNSPLNLVKRSGDSAKLRSKRELSFENSWRVNAITHFTITNAKGPDFMDQVQVKKNDKNCSERHFGITCKIKPITRFNKSKFRD